MAEDAGSANSSRGHAFRGHAAKGIVVAPQPTAAAVGAEVLRAGGNAVDAAIAAGFVQGVVDPFMGGVRRLWQHDCP